MIFDLHAYLDLGRITITDYENYIKKNNISSLVISSPCTETFEPDKSEFSYFIQRKLLSNNITKFIAKIISQSFYDSNGELKNIWKLFTKDNKTIKKVIIPNNKIVYDAIKRSDKIKMWYWVNPSFPDSINEDEINLFKDKIFGIKLHQYWHNFKFESCESILKIAKNKKYPIYIILGYQNYNEAIKMIEKNKENIFIFGYAGFPHFKSFWKKASKLDNVYFDISSNHIDKNYIKKIINIINTKKIVYSSDCPYNFKDENKKFSYEKNILRIKDALNNNEQDKLDNILFKNAKNFNL